MKAIPIVVVCLIASSFATMASAQPESQPVETQRVDSSLQTLRMPMAIWATAVAADQLTTYRFSSGYRDLLHETNPLVSGLDQHPALLVAAGTAIDAATAWAAYRLLSKRHPRLLKMAFYGAAAYRTYLAAYNVEMMRQARAVRIAGLPGEVGR
jgi:hypothetical protein